VQVVRDVSPSLYLREISEIYHPISPIDVTLALPDTAQFLDFKSQNQYQSSIISSEVTMTAFPTNATHPSNLTSEWFGNVKICASGHHRGEGQLRTTTHVTQMFVSCISLTDIFSGQTE
jgi:hypothetical protein